ncbi:rmp1p [Saccharomyces arboricola H-6]|uniref:Rmp1p n=1 Tax=Saccharomyces arboricola (strain H-6 / AS 2.3317 / CBS 10644) TaxID=1160507 RepID=J8PZB9_SACAR|nr:rmp1p [Saccharomyces arboricola H-6]
MDDMNDVVRSLEQEYRLILLLNHRNKNQHRVAVWYGSFNELKRNCGQIVQLLSSRRLQKKSLKDTEWVKLYRLLQKALSRQLKRWYWQFNGVIALGQFVTLGCTLVALLANLKALYMKILELNDAEFARCGCYIKELPKEKEEPVMNDKEELGVVIDEDIGNTTKENDLVLLPVQVTETSKKKKKKKRKNKSAIDGIFG